MEKESAFKVFEDSNFSIISVYYCRVYVNNSIKEKCEIEVNYTELYQLQRNTENIKMKFEKIPRAQRAFPAQTEFREPNYPSSAF